MIVTGAIRGIGRDQVSAGRAPYEEAKTLKLSRAPDGHQLITLHADRAF
jgi:hypothetical protein